METFFIDDKVIVLPKGETVALLTSSNTVKTVRKILQDPDVTYELHPVSPTGKIFILTLYKDKKLVNSYKCKMLSKDFRLF